MSGWIAWSLTAIMAALSVALLWLLSGERRRRAALRSDLDALAGLVRVLRGSDWQHSLQDLLNYAVERKVLRSAILFSLTDSGDLERRATAQAKGEPAWQEMPDSSDLHRALESGRPVRSGDALLFPLQEQGEPIGLLAVRSAAPVPLLDTLVGLAALTLGEVRNFRRQATLSNTDGLTGLSNHRHFQQSLSIALGQVYLESDPVALLLADIDHFKNVNDTYGHQCGDLVLREIGYLLRTHVPPSALVARYGGEELVVMLHGDEARRAPEVAEALRERVAAHEFRDTGSGERLAITISIGVALYELGEGKNRFIARCDEALYASKRNGRNRVTVAPAGQEAGV